MKVTDLHLEYEELFEDFFCKMLEVRNEAREGMYKTQTEESPDNKYMDFLRYGNFDLYGLTAASDDADVYLWCLELWGLECHHPIPYDECEGSRVCPICKKPSEAYSGEQ